MTSMKGREGGWEGGNEVRFYLLFLFKDVDLYRKLFPLNDYGYH